MTRSVVHGFTGVAFTTCCMKQLSITLDTFQSHHTVSQMVKVHMDGLRTYYNRLSTTADPNPGSIAISGRVGR